jgi:hypothetical protein
VPLRRPGLPVGTLAGSSLAHDRAHEHAGGSGRLGSVLARRGERRDRVLVHDLRAADGARSGVMMRCLHCPRCRRPVAAVLMRCYDYRDGWLCAHCETPSDRKAS